jgi:GH25 family lysozyme M1 (1,4-beta-N-acetylmuramidase)
MTAPAGCVKMIDVSAAQGSEIDWQAVAASGVAIVAVEIGVGNDAPNPLRAVQVSGARAAGLRVIGYDPGFALPADGIHPNRDPVAQVALHQSEAADLGIDPAEPTILDLEVPALVDLSKWATNADLVRAWAISYLSETERITNVPPILYASSGFLVGIRTEEDPELARYRLWVAAWGSPAPFVPDPWTDYWAWQWSNAGVVQGIQSIVDLTWCRG